MAGGMVRFTKLAPIFWGKMRHRRSMKSIANILTKNGHKLMNLNRRKAIRERCLMCLAWNAAEVRNCELTDCALYPFRMGTGKQDPKARDKAIRDYCLWCCCDQKHEVARCHLTDCSLFYFRNSVASRQAKIDSESPAGHQGATVEAI